MSACRVNTPDAAAWLSLEETLSALLRRAWMRRLRLSALVMCLMVPLASSAAAVSTTPYATLYEVLAPVHAIAAYDRLVALERVRSRDGVDPHDIRITIRAKRGAIEVPVGPEGSVDFPVDDAMKTENPPVETNQPKGSLALTVNAALRVSSSSSIAWSDIDAALDQAKALFAKSANGAAAPKPIAGIEIEFDTTAPASVTLAGKGERLFSADANGRVIVNRDMVVESERPQLVFSRRPLHILPYLAP